MKRFRWVLALPFLVFLQFAYADSITTFNLSELTYGFVANQAGDNAGYIFSGPGIYVTGGGSASCIWCLVGASFSPGSTLAPNIFVDFESSQGYVRIGGQTYYEPTLFVSSITAHSFVFPAGGRNPSFFTVTVPASFRLVQGEASNGAFFDVNMPRGDLLLRFDYFPAANGNPASYYFVQGHYKGQGVATIPEPSTIGLVATGLAGMVELIRRKRGQQTV